MDEVWNFEPADLAEKCDHCVTQWDTDGFFVWVRCDREVFAKLVDA